MMKNLLVGFLVSLLGALPFGMINITAYYLFEARGTEAMLYFICGVAAVELLVVLVLLKMLARIRGQSKWFKGVEWASVLLLIVLGVSFLLPGHGNEKTLAGVNYSFLAYPPLLTGLFFNGVNLTQVPFWAGWNLFLSKNGYIDIDYKYGYAMGTSIGTCTGIILFVGFFSLVGEVGWGEKAIQFLMPATCIVLAVYQVLKIVQKNKPVSI